MTNCNSPFNIGQRGERPRQLTATVCSPLTRIIGGVRTSDTYISNPLSASFQSSKTFLEATHHLTVCCTKGCDPALGLWDNPAELHREQVWSVIELNLLPVQLMKPQD